MAPFWAELQSEIARYLAAEAVAPREREVDMHSTVLSTALHRVSICICIRRVGYKVSVEVVLLLDWRHALHEETLQKMYGR